MPKKPSKLYLKLDSLDSEKAQLATNLVEIFSGVVRVVLYDSSEQKYINYTGSGADASEKLISELVYLLGEDSVVLK